VVGQVEGAENAPLVEHWDGHGWSRSEINPVHAILDDVAMEGHTVIAVGQTTDRVQRPIIVMGC